MRVNSRYTANALRLAVIGWLLFAIAYCVLSIIPAKPAIESVTPEELLLSPHMFGENVAEVSEQAKRLNGRRVKIIAPLDAGYRGYKLIPRPTNDWSPAYVGINCIPSSAILSRYDGEMVEVTGTFNVEKSNLENAKNDGWRYQVVVDSIKPLTAASLPSHSSSLILIIFGGSGSAIFAVWGLQKRKERISTRWWASGRCPSCGYDMRVTPDICSECGWSRA